ncbi:MAG TPA: hypothetical protein VFJ03_04715 [Candidatus Limnocylindria bacterium]|jgi:hypothetical protein|nr:hypothetical protein [Candidatus Limnocylindria bacterium]
MKKTHPAFWGAGWAGMFTGTLLVAIGISNPVDVGSLAGGYGLMLIGSAVFLLAGLRLRAQVTRRTASVSTRTAHPATAPSRS